MRLVHEDQLLEISFRKAVIEEIKGTENVSRKAECFKRHEIYKDKTKKWVIDALLKHLKEETVEQMSGRVSNISICRKIVDKLAQTYLGGVNRTVEPETEQEKIETLARLTDFNSKMKKLDRYLELQKNTMQYIVPVLNTSVSQDEKQLFDLKVRALAPYEYDVIEDYRNREQAKAVVLTEFVEKDQVVASSIDGYAYGVRSDQQRLVSGSGDRKDQIIADSPGDENQPKRQFIFWSNKYHFTTDENGQIIKELSPEDLLNPIEILPFVNYSEDQSGSFWAEGGDDLIDGSILINLVITDMLGIANSQGWGQIVVTGKNLPDSFPVGPHTAIKLEQAEGEPTPTFEFKSSNPPIESWLRMAEQYTALLLSSNNLSPSTVAAKLDAVNAASGIAMLIEQSESTRDIEDRQKIYKDNEPIAWEIMKRWQNLLFNKDALSPEFKEIGTLGDLDVQLKFVAIKPVVTEEQKLNAIKLRKELGINTMVDLIRIDNPDLTEKEAEEKLKEILKEKLERATQFVMPENQNPNLEKDEENKGIETEQSSMKDPQLDEEEEKEQVAAG